jgi:adenine-specific DNA methylase
MTHDKRFIEESFPVREVSVESAREKNIRHGHISTLHIWWARRPLASSRATSYSALIPAPGDVEEWDRERQFIAEFSKWENSLNQGMIERARKRILDANGGRPPKVLDPFAGGGAIPLEALRLGCEVYSSDYNPVAVLIQKCTLEYPQKYGEKLLKDVKRWGDWVLEEAKKELERFYPCGRGNPGAQRTLSGEAGEDVPVGYIWARTIPCQNPQCGAEIPLMRQFWLAKKPGKKVALYPYVEGKEVRFKITGDGYEPMPPGFDPKEGTVSRAVATCPVCGSTVDAKSTRQLFQEGRAGQRMVAVVTHRPGTSGKRYRTATEEDMGVFREAEGYLKEKREKLMAEWGLDPVPDEPIHTPDNQEYRPGNLLYNFTPVVLYGMTTWGDLFNPRQKLALITFTEKVRKAHQKMLEEGYEEEYARAVSGYLGLHLDKIASSSNSLSRWQPNGEKIADVFARQALPMVWDYPEVNMLTGKSRSFKELFKDIEANIQFRVQNQNPATVTQSSATSLPYPEGFFDAVFTDPPYYDNVPYADLSDFFYVWLKRSIGYLYPELFSTPTTPKSGEAIAELPLLRGMNKEKASKIVKGIKTKQHFEDMLAKSFQEIHRVLKDNGVAVIVYAHKTTEGWETLINSLLDSGLVMSGAWPLNTEMASRLRAKESAALASSIYIVARKMERAGTGFYSEVNEELKKYLNRKLERLWQEGIGGADFFIAAIGSAIEVFGRYEKVMDYEGNIIRADRLLEDVRKIATDYAVRQILHNGFAGEISDLTRFYVLYRWNYGEAKAHFDDARKLAQSCGIDLPKEWTKENGFIKKEREFVKVLGPHQREIEEMEDSEELIDVLHHSLLLWEKGKKSDIAPLFVKKGYGLSEALYRVAQAVSQSLPVDSRERKLLDGFLSGKEQIKEAVRKLSAQKRLG